METFPQIITVKDQEQGLSVAKDILYEKSDNQTLLLLSGGSTPKGLYQALAKEKKILAGVVGMIDERADRSNYKMIKATGLLDYLQNSGINFYPMINVEKYDATIHDLISSFKNKVAIMGIGEDGHTAGLPPGIKNSKVKSQNYAIGISDFPGEFRERITLTFRALSEMTYLLVLVFGENKKEALAKMFQKGSVEEIPARFYLRPDIAGKTILITDQKM